jgi:Fur family transcriptional regulator, iron response regulator
MRLKASNVPGVLEVHGIKPSPQRLAAARYILCTDDHPSADQVWKKARKTLPGLSRASVYNTLNLLVRKGLVRRYAVSGGGVVFDASVGKHHHFIDENSGRIHDVPWQAVEVSGIDKLSDFAVREYHVVMRGRRTAMGRRTRKRP